MKGRDRETHTLFGEEHVDGFPSGEAVWVAYCPECGAKLPLADHTECRFYRGREVDEHGNVVAFRCGYPPAR